MIRQLTEGIAGGTEDQIHPHHHHRHPHVGNPGIRRPQHDEGIGEPSKRKEDAQNHHKPPRRGIQFHQSGERREVNLLFDGLLVVVRRLMNPEENERQTHQSRNQSDPKNRPEVFGKVKKEDRRQQGPHESPGGIHRLPYAVGGTQRFFRGHVRHQSVARRTSEPLTDTVGKPSPDHREDAGC